MTNGQRHVLIAVAYLAGVIGAAAALQFEGEVIAPAAIGALTACIPLALLRWWQQ